MLGNPREMITVAEPRFPSANQCFANTRRG
jgi:hypothetical protein